MIYSFMQPQVISRKWQPFLLGSTPLHWQNEATEWEKVSWAAWPQCHSSSCLAKIHMYNSIGYRFTHTDSEPKLQ